METDIQLGSYTVATISLDDERRVRGLGGPLSPALEVGLTVRLQPMRDLALGWLRAELWLPLRVPVQLGVAETVHWPGGMHAHDRVSTNHPCRFRFALNDGHARALEDMGAESGQGPIRLEVRFEVEAQLVRWVGNSLNADPRAPDLGIDMNYGLVAHSASFMTASVQPLGLQVSRSHWIEGVLPDLGASTLRLIAVRLPQEGHADAEVLKHFDKARQHLDAGRATEAIHACRAVRDAFAQAVGMKSPAVVRALAERRGISAERPGVVFLQETWDALAHLTDVGSHPVAREFSINEARACVLATALLLEALSPTQP